MGCICSKAVTRSMSIREELNYGFQSTAVAWEELMMNSHSGNEQLFAFVCSSNTTKLRNSSNFNLSENDPETAPEAKNFSDTWDQIPEIKENSIEYNAGEFSRFTRSKSCQMLREKEAETTDGENYENRLVSRDKNLIGSRSFHTVEEYDALLERIRREESFQDYYCSSGDVKSEEVSKSSARDQNTEEAVNGEEVEENMDNFKNDESEREIGWKRKALAKGLRSLDVSSVEFPAIGRVKQWKHVEGQVFSPGTYVTPKFGSYNNKIMAVSSRDDEGRPGENSGFIPELVAAFEDCMQQLKTEEENILRHIDEYLPPDDDEMKNQAEGASDVEITRI